VTQPWVMATLAAAVDRPSTLPSLSLIHFPTSPPARKRTHACTSIPAHPHRCTWTPTCKRETAGKGTSAASARSAKSAKSADIKSKKRFRPRPLQRSPRVFQSANTRTDTDTDTGETMTNSDTEETLMGMPSLSSELRIETRLKTCHMRRMTHAFHMRRRIHACA